MGGYVTELIIFLFNESFEYNLICFLQFLFEKLVELIEFC